jgi:hypothetical protein
MADNFVGVPINVLVGPADDRDAIFEWGDDERRHMAAVMREFDDLQSVRHRYNTRPGAAREFAAAIPGLLRKYLSALCHIISQHIDARRRWLTDRKWRAKHKNTDRIIFMVEDGCPAAHLISICCRVLKMRAEDFIAEFGSHKLAAGAYYPSEAYCEMYRRLTVHMVRDVIELQQAWYGNK